MEEHIIDAFIREVLREHVDAAEHFLEQASPEIQRVAERLAATFQAGGKVLFFGNGGSAADAQHMAAEFVGRFVSDRPSLPALSLATDTSLLTAVANDLGYERVFARQIEGLGRRGDVAFGITTSGRSPSVLEGLREARRLGLITVGLLGRDGGDARGLVDHPLVVAGSRTARIQEVHILTGHLLCEMVERLLFGP